MKRLRLFGSCAVLGSVVVLAGCVAVPGAYDGYADSYYVDPGPAIVAPQVYIDGTYYSRPRYPSYYQGRPIYHGPRPGYGGPRPGYRGPRPGVTPPRAPVRPPAVSPRPRPPSAGVPSGGPRAWIREERRPDPGSTP